MASAIGRDPIRARLRNASCYCTIRHLLERRPRGFVRNESPRFEASTAIAPTVRPSSAAMRSTGIVPAMTFSLATSCSVHERLDSGTPTLPTKARKPASWKMFLRYWARSHLVGSPVSVRISSRNESTPVGLSPRFVGGVYCALGLDAFNRAGQRRSKCLFGNG